MVMRDEVVLAQVFARWIVAFVLAYLLGGRALALVFGLILIHQAIYSLIGKRNGAWMPVPLLFLIAPNIALRMLAGMVLVVGSHWTPAPLTFLLLLFYLNSFGVMSAYWKMKLQHYRNSNKPMHRLQSLYFLQHGERWQHVGLIAAALVGLLLVVTQIVAEPCNNSLGSSAAWYGHCTGTGSFIYTELDWKAAVLALVALSMIVDMHRG